MACTCPPDCYGRTCDDWDRLYAVVSLLLLRAHTPFARPMGQAGRPIGGRQITFVPTQRSHSENRRSEQQG